MTEQGEEEREQSRVESGAGRHAGDQHVEGNPQIEEGAHSARRHSEENLRDAAPNTLSDEGNLSAGSTQAEAEAGADVSGDPQTQESMQVEEQLLSEETEPSPNAETTPAGPPKDTSRMHWYVVHAYSGFELKAKQALEERIRLHKLDHLFGEVHVPQETVVELVKGQKKTSSRKFFPGYMLVQMELNQDTWHLVKETPKVTGFVGDATDPSPLSEDEVARIVAQVEAGTASPRSKMSFEQGETVKVVDGPFTDFNGTIEEVKPEKGKVRVLISIFGRATPVELDFMQVEKC